MSENGRAHVPRPGALVWAKMEGYRWWPAEVLEPGRHAAVDKAATAAAGGKVAPRARCRTALFSAAAAQMPQSYLGASSRRRVPLPRCGRRGRGSWALGAGFPVGPGLIPGNGGPCAAGAQARPPKASPGPLKIGRPHRGRRCRAQGCAAPHNCSASSGSPRARAVRPALPAHLARLRHTPRMQLRLHFCARAAALGRPSQEPVPSLCARSAAS